MRQTGATLVKMQGRSGRRAGNRSPRFKLKLGKDTVLSYTAEEARELRQVLTRGKIADSIPLANSPYKPRKRASSM